jgi:hypothetical protein
MSEQERLSFLASRDLLSINEASAFTPYSGEYLSLLARKGKLPAIKIARNWLTTRKAVLVYLQKQQTKHQKMVAQLQELQKGVV